MVSRNAAAKFVLTTLFTSQRLKLSFGYIRDSISLLRAEYSLESIRRNNRIENLILIIIDELLLLFARTKSFKIMMRSDFYNATLCCVWAMSFRVSFHWRLKRPRHVSARQTVDTQSISICYYDLSVERNRTFVLERKILMSHNYQFVALISVIELASNINHFPCDIKHVYDILKQ